MKLVGTLRAAAERLGSEGQAEHASELALLVEETADALAEVQAVALVSAEGILQEAAAVYHDALVDVALEKELGGESYVIVTRELKRQTRLAERLIAVAAQILGVEAGDLLSSSSPQPPQRSLSEYLDLEYPMALEARNGGWVVYHTDLPGCVAGGPTTEAAVAKLDQARADWIRSRIDRKLPVPEPHSLVKGLMVER